jgi:tRNA A37 N6-isopentenylltransferase MiaA
MYRDAPSAPEPAFESNGGLDESHHTVKDTRREATVIVEGGSQALLGTFLKTRLDIPDATLERVDATRSRVSMIEQKKHELFELLRQRLPDVFKVTSEEEANEAA